MPSSLSSATGLSGNFETILLIISIVFTVGVIIAIFLVAQQVIKSKWIDSYAVIVFLILTILSVSAIAGIWTLYLLYV